MYVNNLQKDRFIVFIVLSRYEITYHVLKTAGENIVKKLEFYPKFESSDSRTNPLAWWMSHPILSR